MIDGLLPCAGVPRVLRLGLAWRARLQVPSERLSQKLVPLGLAMRAIYRRFTTLHFSSTEVSYPRFVPLVSHAFYSSRPSLVASARDKRSCS